MILAVDVNYRDSGAIAAGVAFRKWDDKVPESETAIFLPEVENYISGSFYLRELPCIIRLLSALAELPDIIIIDGYVWLGESRKPGLGMHLYNTLHGKCAIIGAAKTRYKDSPPDSAIYRGKSTRPLYITAAGMNENEARDHIKNMYGPDRIPSLIKRADRLSRQLNLF